MTSNQPSVEANLCVRESRNEKLRREESVCVCVSLQNH